MTDFSAILSTNMSTIEKPKPLPEGTYAGTIKTFSLVTSAKKGTPGVEVVFEINAPMDDVDQDALAKVKWEGRKMTTTLWLTDNSLFMLVDLLKACGIDIENRQLSEGVEELPERAVGAKIIQELSANVDADGDQIIYTNIAKFVSLD